MTARRAGVEVAPVFDVRDLVQDLKDTATGLQRHIDAAAAKKAAEMAKVYAKAADERVQAAESELLRATDLVGELRRQLAVAHPRMDRLAAVEKRLRAESLAGSQLARELLTLIYPPDAPAVPSSETDHV